MICGPRGCGRGVCVRRRGARSLPRSLGRFLVPGDTGRSIRRYYPKPVRSVAPQTRNEGCQEAAAPGAGSTERAELHGDVASAISLRCIISVIHASVAITGPVADQLVGRRPHRIHAALELGDEVLLVAALVGQPNYFCRAHVRARGDVVVIADLVDQGVLALRPADVLADHDHPVLLAALARTVLELGNVFAVQRQVLYPRSLTIRCFSFGRLARVCPDRDALRGCRSRGFHSSSSSTLTTISSVGFDL